MAASTPFTSPEAQVREFVLKKNLPYQFGMDGYVEKTKTLYRPDFVFRGEHVSVLLELDENGHESYDQNKEVQRMTNLWTAFDARAIFLRVFVHSNEVLPQSMLEIIHTYVVKCSNDLPVHAEKPTVVYLEYPAEMIARRRVHEDVLDIHAFETLEESKSRELVFLSCGRCGKQFKHKSDILRHLRGPRECLPSKAQISRPELITRLLSKTKAYPCTWCDKSFAHESGFYRHRRTCANRPRVSEQATIQPQAQSAIPPESDDDIDRIARLEAMLAKASEELSRIPKLEAQIEELSSKLAALSDN